MYFSDFWEAAPGCLFQEQEIVNHPLVFI